MSTNTIEYEIEEEGEDRPTERGKIVAEAMAYLSKEHNLPKEVTITDVTVKGRSYRRFDGPVQITIVEE